MLLKVLPVYCLFFILPRFVIIYRQNYTILQHLQQRFTFII